MLDGETFELKGNWENECEAPPTGYDFWYQPRHNVLISTAGLVPKRAGCGFNPNDLKKGEGIGIEFWGGVLLRGQPPLLTCFSFLSGVFGRRLNVWNLSCRTLTQCFDLGEDSLPLSVKFLHNPDAAEGYVSCALSGIVYRFYKCEASVLPAAMVSYRWWGQGREEFGSQGERGKRVGRAEPRPCFEHERWDERSLFFPEGKGGSPS